MPPKPRWTIGVVVIALAVLLAPPSTGPQDVPTALRKVIVAEGVELHYDERGTGVPVVFVHGSLSDGSY